MIPKIAHFHWDGDGPAMSWLRTVSIATFAKFNPDWEIRIIRSDPALKNSGLCYGQKADLAWWEALRDHGGFQVATDIVFVKPVPDAWLSAPFCATTRGFGRVYEFPMLGAVKGHPFFVEAAAKAREITPRAGDAGYQDLGVWLLRALGLPAEVYELPTEAMCSWNWTYDDMFWSQLEASARPLHAEAIGVHWYGGATKAKELEWSAGPDSGYFITNLANTVFP